MIYHISVQGGHELARATRQEVDLIQTVVEVTCLEVMRLSGNLLTRHVNHVGVNLGKLLAGVLESLRLGVVQDDDSHRIAGVVLVTGTTDCIEDDIVLLSTACNEDIHRRTFIAHQTQLGSATLLQGHHGPAIMHERGDSHSDFNRDEHPGAGVRHLGDILCHNNAGNAKTQIEQVDTRVCEGEEGHEEKDPSLPPFPNFRIVTVVKVNNRSRLDPILRILGESR